MPMLLFVVVFLASVFSIPNSIIAAPEICGSNYTCTDEIVLGKDCIPKSTNGCVQPGGGTGNFCCRDTIIVNPPPATTCVSNGNYCVGTSTECFPGDIPGQGGTCPGTGTCCQIPGGPGPTTAPQPISTPLPIQNPQTKGFDLLKYPCPTVANTDFHPLRPYPGSPCDPLIPKSWPEEEYISFACGKSANVGGDIEFPKRVNLNSLSVMPSNPSPDTFYRCNDDPSKVCVVKRADYDITIDLSGAKIPILGNTQDPNLSDAARVNQYLLSYLTGTVQQAEQKPLGPSTGSFTPAATSPISPNANLKILPLGDSITGGYYICSLAKMLPNSVLIGPNEGAYCSSVHHAGYGSFSAVNLLSAATMGEWLPFTKEATHVLIHIGTNDIYSKYTEEQFRAYLTQIVNRIKQENPSVVVVLAQIIPNEFHTTDVFNDTISQIAQETGSKLVNAGAGFDTTIHLSDEVHPNAAGGEVIARNFAAGITGQASSIGNVSSGPISAIDRLINYSGPIKKLLSFDSQNKIKSDLTLGAVGTQYHNYMLGCNQVININPDDYEAAFKDIINTFITNALSLAKILIQLVVIGTDNLKSYAVVFGDVLYAATQGATKEEAKELLLAGLQNEFTDQASLNAWKDLGNLIIDAGLENARNVGASLASIQKIEPNQAVACTEAHALTEKIRLSSLPAAGKLPPVQGADEKFSDFWKRYLEWKGYVNVPIIGPVDIPFVGTSIWAQMFKNVPFSTLEDTMSEFTISLIEDPKHQPPGVILNDPQKPITLKITNADSRLSFPHVRAIDALAGLLQRISAPKGLGAEFNQKGEIKAHQKSGDGPNPQLDKERTLKQVGPPGNSSVVAGKEPPFPLFTSHDSVCDLKDVRINPGDNLYGNQVTANLSYYQKFSYTPDNSAPVGDPNKLETGEACTQPEQCQSNNCLPENLLGQRYCGGFPEGIVELPSEARIAVFSKTPLIDKIYDKLVAGPTSILRRFIAGPKCAPNCTSEEKKRYIRQDGETIPSAIDAAYTGEGVSAGDETGGGQIYIPRLGSLFDYFLGGSSENMNLQKALRPKGFGGVAAPGLVGLGGGSCAVPQIGLCAPNDPVSNLSGNFGQHVNQAAQICNRESGGVADVINDGCLQFPIYSPGHSVDYSIGLFQINLLVHPSIGFINNTENDVLVNSLGNNLKEIVTKYGAASCYEAFSNRTSYLNGTSSFCEVGNPGLLSECEDWFQKPANNIAYAKALSGGGTNWTPWSAAKACNIN
jgi:lysophospholipase L1-like esterase